MLYFDLYILRDAIIGAYRQYHQLLHETFSVFTRHVLQYGQTFADGIDCFPSNVENHRWYLFGSREPHWLLFCLSV